MKIEKHVLFETEDADRPACVCDSNGDVVLSLCRICGKGEADLEQECPVGPREILIDTIAHLAAAISAYERYVGRVDRVGQRDPFYRTRIRDFQKSLERGRAFLKKDEPSQRAASKGDTL